MQSAVQNGLENDEDDQQGQRIGVRASRLNEESPCKDRNMQHDQPGVGTDHQLIDARRG